MIGGIIGPGGKIIQKMQTDTETTITINEEDNKGKLKFLGTDQDGMARAEKLLRIFVSFQKLEKFIKELLNQFNPMVHLLKLIKELTDCYIFLKFVGKD